MVIKPSVMDAFIHCPRCGSPHFIAQNASLRICESCNYHHHFNPVCAVGALISDDQNRVLLIERAKEPAKGKWGVPGGFTDIGECMEDTLHREVEEEIGLTLYATQYLASHSNAYEYRGVIIPTIDVFFCAKAHNFDIKMQQGEVANWSFLRQDQIKADAIAFDSMRFALKKYWAFSKEVEHL